MTNKDFYRELGNIDPEMIEAAAPGKKAQKKVWTKWVAMAACLALIAAGGIFGKLFRAPDTTPSDAPLIESYFVITAHAADGESTELGFEDGCFNSSGLPKENIFGVDMPLFNFSVRPADLKNNEAIYERFEISVSYNGTVVDMEGKVDEHIMITVEMPIQGVDAPWAYCVFGWFTEPTDIIVTITDKESREIVETITVNVNYLTEKQGYDLSITNLTTKFFEQKEAVGANNALMAYLFGKGYVTNYPEWFGGCYIEGNKLHIRLVSPSEEEMKRISDVLVHFGDVVVYENAERSMTELQAYADQTADELRKLGYEVTSWYVDSITGNIVIAVLEKDFEAATAWVGDTLKNESDPQIVIEKGGYIDLESQVTEFCADPFLQDAALSWMYSIDVKIDMDNSKIYLNDVLYDQISYVENFKPDYGNLVPGPYVNEKITEVLDRIDSQKGCYMLETQSESKCGKQIAMYVIEDTYYFIRFFDNGKVMRIHSGTVR